MGEMAFYYALIAVLIVYLPVSLYFNRSWRRAAKVAEDRRTGEQEEPLDPELRAAIRKAVRRGEAIQDRQAAVAALEGWRRSGGFGNPVVTGLSREALASDVALAAGAVLAWLAGFIYIAYFAVAVLAWSIGMWLYRWLLGRRISRSIDATRRLHGLD